MAYCLALEVENTCLILSNCYRNKKFNLIAFNSKCCIKCSVVLIAYLSFSSIGSSVVVCTDILTKV